MLLLLSSLALAEPGSSVEPGAEPEPVAWKDKPVEARALTDGTAFTVGKKHWRIGLVNQDYGLLKNTSIGTAAPLWLLGVANAHAKVTAIQTPKFDASLQAGWFYADLTDLGLPGASVSVTPVGWVGSWTPLDSIGLHFGTTWTMATARGNLTAADIGAGLAAATGADITEDLVSVVGTDGGLYAGANLSLLKTHVQFEYRLNRRDSLILVSDAYVHLNGLLAAGVAVDGADADVEVGASARVSMPLAESLPALTAASWQWSWRRFNLRLGVPLPLGNTFAWLHAVDMYWVLGPSRHKD